MNDELWDDETDTGVSDDDDDESYDEDNEDEIDGNDKDSILKRTRRDYSKNGFSWNECGDNSVPNVYLPLLSLKGYGGKSMPATLLVMDVEKRKIQYIAAKGGVLLTTLLEKIVNVKKDTDMTVNKVYIDFGVYTLEHELINLKYCSYLTNILDLVLHSKFSTFSLTKFIIHRDILKVTKGVGVFKKRQVTIQDSLFLIHNADGNQLLDCMLVSASEYERKGKLKFKLTDASRSYTFKCKNHPDQKKWQKALAASRTQNEAEIFHLKKQLKDLENSENDDLEYKRRVLQLPKDSKQDIKKPEFKKEISKVKFDLVEKSPEDIAQENLKKKELEEKKKREDRLKREREREDQLAKEEAERIRVAREAKRKAKSVKETGSGNFLPSGIFVGLKIDTNIDDDNVSAQNSPVLYNLNGEIEPVLYDVGNKDESEPVLYSVKKDEPVLQNVKKDVKKDKDDDNLKNIYVRAEGYSTPRKKSRAHKGKGEVSVDSDGEQPGKSQYERVSSLKSNISIESYKSKKSDKPEIENSPKRSKMYKRSRLSNAAKYSSSDESSSAKKARRRKNRYTNELPEGIVGELDSPKHNIDNRSVKSARSSRSRRSRSRNSSSSRSSGRKSTRSRSVKKGSSYRSDVRDRSVTIHLKGENDALGLLEISSRTTYDQIRVRMKKEFDPEVLPVHFRFLRGDVRVSRKQEQMYYIKDNIVYIADIGEKKKSGRINLKKSDGTKKLRKQPSKYFSLKKSKFETDMDLIVNIAKGRNPEDAIPIGMVRMNIAKDLISLRKAVCDELDGVPEKFVFLLGNMIVPVGNRQEKLKHVENIVHKENIYIRSLD